MIWRRIIAFMSFLAADSTNKTPTSMLFACWAIVIILLLMSFTFLRARRKEYAVAILPLLVTPFVYIVSGLLAFQLAKILPLSAIDIRIMINMIAALVSCLLLGLLSRGIPGKRTRNVFFWCCAGFIVILSLVLIGRLLIMTSSLAV